MLTLLSIYCGASKRC